MLSFFVARILISTLPFLCSFDNESSCLSELSQRLLSADWFGDDLEIFVVYSARFDLAFVEFVSSGIQNLWVGLGNFSALDNANYYTISYI